MDYIELGYIGLFLACFLAATIIPFVSEGVLVLFLVAGFDPIYCLLIATLGNSLGGLTNYLLGMIAKPEKVKKLFKHPDKFQKKAKQVSKYGFWLGIFSWTPIVGDPLTILLGFFRVKFIPFLILMTLGKLFRYAVIIFIWSQ